MCTCKRVQGLFPTSEDELGLKSAKGAEDWHGLSVGLWVVYRGYLNQLRTGVCILAGKDQRGVGVIYVVR